MRVLITGATGFIGGALVGRLVEEGVAVRASHRAGSDTAALDRLGVERVLFDLVRPETAPEAVSGCTHVVHLGALRGHGGVPLGEIDRVNIGGTTALALAAASAGAERFVFGSTLGVYGFVTRSPIDEATALRPNTPYRRSKAAAERALRTVEAETGLPVAIARICSTVGPGSSNWDGLIEAIRGGRLRLLGDGANRLHTAHVSEIVDALWRCAVRPEAAGETFVLAGDKPVSVRAFTRLVAEALGVAAPGLGPPASPYVVASHVASAVFRTTGVYVPWLHTREFLVADKWADLSRARDLLGYRPSWTVEASISDMIAGTGAGSRAS